MRLRPFISVYSYTQDSIELLEIGPSVTAVTRFEPFKMNTTDKKKYYLTIF